MIWVLLAIALLFIFGIIRFALFKKNRTYLDLWHKDFYKSYDDPRKQIIAHGLLASSGHNTQPWRFVLHEDKSSFDMYIDRCHLTKEVDPDHRQLLISQGTCLKNMEIGATVLGYGLTIDVDVNEQWNIYQRFARLKITKTNPKIHKVYEHMFKPDTHRGKYKNTKLTEDLKRKIKELNHIQGVSIDLIDDNEAITHLSHIALEGAFIEARNEDVMNETQRLFKNNEEAKRINPYGFSLEGQGLSSFMIWFIQILMRFFPSFNHIDQTKKAFLNQTKIAIDHTYTYMMIKSDEINEYKLVEIGMLYQDIILQLHDLGLVIQPLSQAIEVYDDMKPVYGKIHEHYGNERHILMLARLGYPEKPFMHTMRCKPDQVIEEVIS